MDVSDAGDLEVLADEYLRKAGLMIPFLRSKENGSGFLTNIFY